MATLGTTNTSINQIEMLKITLLTEDLDLVDIKSPSNIKKIT